MANRQNKGKPRSQPIPLLKPDELKSESSFQARCQKHGTYTCSSCNPAVAGDQPPSNTSSSKTKAQKKPTPDGVRSSCFSCTSNKPGDDGKDSKTGASKASKGLFRAMKNKGRQVYKETLEAADAQHQPGTRAGNPEAIRTM